MLLLHVGVHRARYRELIAIRPIPGQEPPEPLTVDCPRCGDRYVAELHPYEEWPDLEEQEWEAVTALEAECPEHAHFFEVG
jgi:hypothetical protein